MSLTTPSGGIEELVDATSGREIVATPVVVDRFEDLTKKYEQYLNVRDKGTLLKDHVEEILSPCDLNIFVQQTRHYEDHTSYDSDTGDFISQLIQNSYHAGNNDFELDMKYLKIIDYLASDISGTEERMVKMVITGEVGMGCGSRVRYSTFIIPKVGKYCGRLSKHSSFTIEKAGDWCGWEAQHSTFIIEKAGNWTGYFAEHSTFTIGKAGEDCGRFSTYSTFKTHNQDQYERFKESVPQNEENKLYLLSSDDSIIQGGEW